MKCIIFSRSEGGSKKHAQCPPVDPASHKSSSSAMKNSPSRLAPSPNDSSRISPNRNASPVQKSPNSLSSPRQFSQNSPSVPVLVPPTSSYPNQTASALNHRQRKPPSPVKSNMPTFSQLGKFYPFHVPFNFSWGR